MNIFKRELRAGFKPFILWTAGMFFLCYAGIIKYESFTVSDSMTELLNSFPRIVLAVMGAVGIDISTLGGYTALLFYYVLICVVIYAVHLGSSAVTRESVDRTYEFVFVKPRTRTYVLFMKLASAYLLLFAFCVCNGLFAMMAVEYLKVHDNITVQIWLCSLSVFLIGSLFIALAAFFASAVKQPEKGSLYGNIAFLYAFLLGVAYNMLESPGVLRLISPFNYFASADLVANKLELLYIALTLSLTAFLLYGTNRNFAAKDLL